MKPSTARLIALAVNTALWGLIALAIFTAFDRAMRIDHDQICRTTSAPVAGCP